jgi:hypothetical protein
MSRSSEDFDSIATDPHSWLTQAWQHLYAVKLIADHFQALTRQKPPTRSVRDQQVATIKALCLLLAFSLENGLKALIIASNRNVIKEKGIDVQAFGGGKTGHSLPKLAQKAGVATSDAEADLFRRLTLFAEWGGRYPLPRTKTEYEKSTGNRSLNWQTDLTLTESILKEIETRLKAIERDS